MNAPPSPTLEARRVRMFPVLAADEIERLHPFGKPPLRRKGILGAAKLFLEA